VGGKMYDENELGELYREFDQGYKWYTKDGKLIIRTTEYHPGNLEVSIGDLEMLLKRLRSQVKDPDKE
jgi:hypothetical protein